VAGENNSRDEIAVDERSRLKDGLKSCHNVVENYRSMLEGQSRKGSPPEAANEGDERD